MRWSSQAGPWLSVLCGPCVLGVGLACAAPAATQGVTESPAIAIVLPEVAPGALRPPAAFDAVRDSGQRSRALFTELARVLLHPRCVNCHVEGDSPAQGAHFDLHEPPVLRGPEDRGVVGMECESCHQDRNLELSRVPGAVGWKLPPRGMAWQGKAPSELCAQLKDPVRNGQRGLADIVEHSRRDPLVAWGWQPGFERQPAPGSQAEFAALVAAWVSSGAECPSVDDGMPVNIGSQP